MTVGYTYNPNEVLLVIGKQPITGFADGSQIAMPPNSSLYSTTYGSKNNNIPSFVRSKQLDVGAMLTFTLMINSPSNTFLSGLIVADKATGSGIVPFMLKARTGVIASIASGFGWVDKYIDPSYSMGGDAPVREWEFFVAEYTQFEGGGTLPLVGV